MNTQSGDKNDYKRTNLSQVETKQEILENNIYVEDDAKEQYQCSLSKYGL